MTREQFTATFGRTSREILAELWGDRIASRQEIAELDDRKEELYRDLLRQEFPAIDGAAELIDSLHAARMRLAVGSSGPKENVYLVLDRLGRRHLFGGIITAADVVRGKPDPQVFLLAAQRVAVPPERCVVIEDAPVGVAAAHAGGMKCVALASTGRLRKELSEAELVVSSLRELDADRIRAVIGGMEPCGSTTIK
jgi:beta-phosphoglucomutase